MTHAEFKNKYPHGVSVGKPFPPYDYVGECVSFVLRYMREVHNVPVNAPLGHAAQIPYNSFFKQHYEKISDPRVGDLMFWGDGALTGAAGHTAIYDGNGKMYNQNWNSDRKVSTRDVFSSAFIGYYRPKNSNQGGNMALAPGQQDKLIKGMLGREPNPTELNDTNWRNNPGLAIDTLWEHGGKQKFVNDRITPNELNDLTGALWGVSPADANHHKNWDGKPFTEAYRATYNDPRTFEYADKVYKALNGGTKYKPYTLPELFVKE